MSTKQKRIERISKYAEVIKCQPDITLAFLLLNAQVMSDPGFCLNRQKHIGIKHNHATPKVFLLNFSQSCELTTFVQLEITSA